ncbi:MAG: hypothetical protein JXA60_03080 [Candidatus Coatesbacteria bacterium]|nr:hypothetical protein [Candidatus Coatesbacteria bacterium]
MQRKVYLLLLICFLPYLGYGLNLLLNYPHAFPLDDTYIHFKIADNLLKYGTISFHKEVFVASSTAPLFSIMLALFTFLSRSFVVSAYLIGGLSHVLFLYFSYLFLNEISKKKIVELRKSDIWLLCIILSLDWHFLWSAFSGMETSLSLALLSIILYLEISENRNLHLKGILLICLVLSRAEMILLILLLLILRIIEAIRNKSIVLLKPYIIFLVGFIVISFFYYFKTNSFVPATSYAKAVFYGLQPKMIFLKSVVDFFLRGNAEGDLGKKPFSIPFFLLPFYIISLFLMIKQKKSPIILIFSLLPLIISIFLYIRLPRLYHHGRYLIPYLSFFYIASFFAFRLMENEKGKSKIFFMIFLSILLVAASIWISGLLYFMGIIAAFLCYFLFYKKEDAGLVLNGAYIITIFLLVHNLARNKDFLFNEGAWIRNNHIKTAEWVNEHIDKDAYLICHDVGAISFMTDRFIIDITGLTAPELIPIIHNHDKIWEILTGETEESRIFFKKYRKDTIKFKADYFILFPGWYRDLLYQERLEKLATNGEMVIFKIK